MHTKYTSYIVLSCTRKLCVPITTIATLMTLLSAHNVDIHSNQLCYVADPGTEQSALGHLDFLNTG